MNHRFIGPFLAWFKDPFRRHFCIMCHNKKSVQYRFSTSCTFQTISLNIPHLQKIFRKKLLVICENKKTQAPKFSFFFQNQNQPTKIDFTAITPLKHIWATRKQSQFHCQNHKNIRPLGGEK